jgi:hypothetical protein
MKIKLHSVRPPRGDEAYFSQEPTYEDKGNITPANYRKLFNEGLAWHAYCAGKEDLQKYLEVWIRVHRAPESETDLRRWKGVPKALIMSTIPSMARMHLQGFPLSDKDLNTIHDFVAGLTEPEAREVSESDKPRVSVQDRIKAQVTDTLSEIDEAADILTDGDDIDIPSMQEVLFDPTFKEPHFRHLIAHLDRYIVEWNEIAAAKASKDQSDDQEQLVEGTRHLKPRTLANAVRTFTTLRDAMKGQVAVAKAKKVRKKKPTDKKKVVARLRYAKEDGGLGITSIDPVDILGASELWVYDTKRRRLQHYVGEIAGSLHVKGPKILGYGGKSGSKVLRKPEEQLKEFMALRKNQTEKWFDGVRAKAAPLNGRTAAYLLLLRVA